MSTLLEGRKEQFLKTKVNLLRMIGEDTEALLDASIAQNMPNIIAQRVFELERDSREECYVKTLIVAGAAAAHLGVEPTLGTLADWLKRLIAKYPTFAQAATIIHGTANIHVAEAVDWSPDEIALLTEEVRGQVQYKGDEGKGPIRSRINHHVSMWLDAQFGPRGSQAS